MCDELGILAWSELIFSDAFYPTNDFFLDSVEREVRQNVLRVNRHPSNAQWAGGNEIEVILPYAPLFFPGFPDYKDEVCPLINDSRRLLIDSSA